MRFAALPGSACWAWANEIGRLFATAISHHTFFGWLENQLACRTILFADTCHAGGFQGKKGVLPPHSAVAACALTNENARDRRRHP